MSHIVYLSSDDDEADKPVDAEGVSDEKKHKSKKRKKTKTTGHRKSNSKVKNEDGDDDDDDCVVLDCDPYQTTEKETTTDTCATDEVLVVGQKGEIACRDFPHPRHACAKYPFNTTPHENFCDMCHCYVCDIRAPCPYWRILFSSMDHCHANSKEQMWKNQRESIRNGETLPRPASSKPQPQQLSQSQSMRSPQNPWYSPAIRPCSVSPNTHTRPGFSTEQSRTAPQNPGLQPRGPAGSYNANRNPQFVSSNPFAATRRPSGAVYPPVPRGGVYPPVPRRRGRIYRASQGNPQGMVTDYISTVPESATKVFARHFNRNMYSGNVQASVVPSATTNPPANQQQQSGRSNSKALSEFEDWLMNDNTPTGPVSPLPGQDNDGATFAFDFESFLK
ncbi:unnamed protein product [Microthlaspi erraticum]|uniref:RPM1 interacting protein 13 n=1 Tax=Microthlaspi erraticum TaxID=1685480 RepID=A0A6D2KAP9_9BRAS|nr:unnamed protein product [Microthlaspi erraticum]